MRIILLFIFTLFISGKINSQNFNGQWKGYFAESSSFVGWGGDKCEYVLELECKGTRVTGYSYTYFNEGGYKYYTICKITGKLNKRTRSVEVTETERTKTNIPYYIRNCFQIHRLTFNKDGDKEILEGTWIPAPNQEGGCGKGSTVLTRRVLKQITPDYNKSQTRVNTQVPKDKPVTNSTSPNAKVEKKRPPVTPNNQRDSNTVAKNNPVIKAEPRINTVPIPLTKKETPVNIQTNSDFEKRNTNVLKTIEIQEETFKVDLYDNGDIDGDTVSLFYNGNLLMAKKRLSAKAISFELNVDPSKAINELTMYAENLGEIPPNTALMIVTDGNKRYEVRITSDLQKSGVIRFVHKE